MWRNLVILGICAFAIAGCGDTDNSNGSSSQQNEYRREDYSDKPSPQANPTIDPFYGDCHGGAAYGCK